MQDFLSDYDFLGPAAARLRGERDADRVADAFLQQHRQRGGRGHDALAAHASLGQPQMQRVIAPRRQLAVDRDQVLHSAHLYRQNDAVVAQADGLGPPCAVQRGTNHRFVHHRRRRFRRWQAGVLIHQPPRQFLIQTAPVHPNSHRLVVPTGDFDNGGELLVLLPAPPDVAGIDTVLVQHLGAGRILAEEAMTVEMKIANQRRIHALRRQALADQRHGGGGLLGVDRHAHQF